MSFFDIADEIIPGYTLLPQKIRTEFENSTAGSDFVTLYFQFHKEKIAALAKVDKDYSGIFSLTTLVTGGAKAAKKTIEQKFADNVSTLLEPFKNEEVYKNLMLKFDEEILRNIYPNPCLNKADIEKLAASKYTSKLTRQIKPFLKSQKSDSYTLTDALDSFFTKESSSIVDEFENKIFADPEFKEQAEKIKMLFLFEHLAKWCELLPLVKNTPLFNDFKFIYLSALKASEYAEIEQRTLEDFFFKCLNANNSTIFDFTEFNHNQAKILSQLVYQDFRENKKINFETWLKNYEYELKLFIDSKLSYLNKSKNLTSDISVLYNSLSFLWKNKATVQGCEFINGMADAKTFLGYFGTTSQNDEQVLTMLDLWNCLRYRKDASETKGMIKSLLKPFSPISQEYRDISLRKRNYFSKIWRSLMPILIVVGVVVLASLLLTPLALPELAFIAAMIPTIIIGLAVASAYIVIKNKTYKFLRELYYGSVWETPEFKITPILKAAFGDKAQEIRDFYIKELAECEKIKTEYEKKLVLSQEEYVLKEANLDKLKCLYFEWMDISANTRLQCKETLYQIVYERLTKTHNTQYQRIISQLGEPIETTANSMTKAIEERISRYNRLDNVKPFTEFTQQTFFGKIPDKSIADIRNTVDLISKISPLDEPSVLELN